jgi:hypothetical protein
MNDFFFPPQHTQTQLWLNKILTNIHWKKSHDPGIDVKLKERKKE